MRTYYVTCPLCGANLDPNEKCDCCNESYSNIKEEKKDGNNN